MTVPSTTSRKTFAGNGVTTSFGTSPVIFFDSVDLTVYVVTTATGAVLATLVLDTDYTVTGGDGSTGTLDLAAGSAPYGAPATGTTLVIVRTLAITQEADFVNNDASDAEVAEDALDRLTMIAQELDGRLDRAFRQADSDTGTLSDLPNFAERANKALTFDADGDVEMADISASSFAFTPITEFFSGTGAQTAFTLARTSTASGIIVDIDGVKQKPSIDYTVSGAVLTFTTAPPSGSNNITVQSFAVAGLVNEVSVDNVVGLAASTGASKVGFLQSSTGPVATTVEKKLQEVKSVFDYMTAAEKADVIAKTLTVDVTTALQTAITQNLTATGGGLYWPNGGYKITAALVIPFSAGWMMCGASRLGVKITQYTANTPIFKFTSNLTHSWTVTDMQFDYSAAQASTNTAACPFYFVGSVGTSYDYFNFTVERVTFNNCCDCFGGDSTTKFSSWGWRKKDITVAGTVSRSVWTYVPLVTIGMPNGRLDGCYVDASTMVGPIFKMSTAGNTRLDGVEINAALLGPKLIFDSGGGTYSIGEFRVEVGTYSGSLVPAFFDIANCCVYADKITLNTITSVLTGSSNVFGASGGAGGFIYVGEFNFTATISGGFSFYIVGLSASNATVVIDHIFQALPTNCYLTNIPAATGCDAVQVRGWNDMKISADIGDAGVTYTPGTSPRIQRYATTLTAARTVTLPNISGSDTNNFNGLSTIVQREASGNFALNITPSGSAAVASFPPYVQGSIEVAYYRQGYIVRQAFKTVIHNTITAFATGGQASATQLTGQLCRITTCTTGGDSVKLPTAVGSGIAVVVVNSGAASCDVFPQSGASIDALAANTALAVVNGKRTTFYDIAANLWMAVPGA